MCFHTKQSKSVTAIQNRFQASMETPLKYKPQNHINGFDYPETPVIIDKTPQIISLYSWGLIPAWAREEGIKKYTLNAKIETVDEKPSFKNAVNQRCLIIANGYYEWKWLDPKGTKKQKYELCLPEEELFAFAGLYSHWLDPYTGALKKTYTILTTEASPLLAEIHNHNQRMPVVLKREDESKWLCHEPIVKFAFPYTTDLVAIAMD